MNAQEIFDTVVKHLAAQKVASKDKALNDGHHYDICAYRGDNGTSCAVGCLIKDEDYSPKMEGSSVRSLYWNEQLPDYLKDEEGLLSLLQLAHDSALDMSDLCKLLRNAAEMYNLDDSSVGLITEWNP